MTKELNEKREKLLADARAALDEIKTNTDEARAAELDTRHDTIMADFDKVEKLIEREARLAAAEKSAEDRAAAERAAKRPVSGDATVRGQVEDKKPEYREAFQQLIIAGDDARLADKYREVLRAGEAGMEHRIQSTTTTAGGYTVPTTLEAVIIKTLKAWGPMYDEDICTQIITASGNPMDMPTTDDTGVTAVAHTEGATATDDGSKDATFGKKTLNAYDADSTWVKFSLEIAQDSIFNMEQLLGDLIGQRMGRYANLALTTGSGSGAPQGIVTGATSGKTAAATNAVTFDEIIDLIHSVDPAYRQSPKVRFMFNDLTLAALRKLKDGEGRYIWTMGDVQQGVQASLLGYKYSVNQAMPAMTTGLKPIVFGDFGKFFVRKVGAPLIWVAREKFIPDVGVFGLIRFDGRIGDPSAVKYLVQA